MRARVIYNLIPSALLIGAAVFLIGLLFLRLLWGWAIPDLLSGSAAQGLMAESFSWSETIKLNLALAALAAILVSRIDKGSQRTN